MNQMNKEGGIAIEDWAVCRQQVENRFRQAVIAAKKERDEGYAAIDVVQRIANGSTKAHSGAYGSFVPKVIAAVDKVPDLFTRRDIVVALNEVDVDILKYRSTATLAGCLASLVVKGIIERDVPGKGSTPTVFKKVPKKQEVLKTNS